MHSDASAIVRESTQPRHRWLRFSLRTFLLLVTVLCIWLGVKFDQARRQKRAVDALEALSAEIAYAHQRVKNGKLMILYLHGTKVTDEGLVHLHGLPMLSRVLLNETRVTPEGIAKLKAASPWTMMVQGP